MTQHLKLVHSQPKQSTEVYREIEKIIDKYGVCLIINAVNQYIESRTDKLLPVDIAKQQLISEHLCYIGDILGIYLPSKFIQKYKRVLTQLD